MQKLLFIPLFIVSFLYGCSAEKNTDKQQTHRTHIIHVQNIVKEIELENVLINSFSTPYICGDYLVVGDHKAIEGLIHVFNKYSFKYLGSIGNLGQGPGEIASLGDIVWNETQQKMYVTDYGKQRIFAYDLDSALHDISYLPIEKLHMSEKLFPHHYYYINDTLSYGIFIEPTSVSTFNQFTGKWNMCTGEVEPLKYNHPDIQKKRISFALSMPHQMYIECNSRYDLMSLFTLSGSLKCNVYGPNWNKNEEKKQHFCGVCIGGNQIYALYDGNNYSADNYPTQCHVFSIDGDYIKTFEFGYKIAHFCFDDDNNRLIFCFEDKIQYGYLDLGEPLG